MNFTLLHRLIAVIIKALLRARGKKSCRTSDIYHDYCNNWPFNGQFSSHYTKKRLANVRFVQKVGTMLVFYCCSYMFDNY